MRALLNLAWSNSGHLVEEYGRVLVAIEELRSHSSVPALGANDGTLLSCVRRFVSLPANTAVRWRWSAPSLAVCGIVAIYVLSLFSWHSLTEAGAQAADLPVAELPDKKPKRKFSEFAARNAELDKLRAEGQAALERGDYSAMSKTYSILSQSPDARYMDVVWLRHSRHIVGKWKEASGAFQRAIELADAGAPARPCNCASVRHNGSNRVPSENESRSESGSVTFTVTAIQPLLDARAAEQITAAEDAAENIIAAPVDAEAVARKLTADRISLEKAPPSWTSWSPRASRPGWQAAIRIGSMSTSPCSGCAWHN